jgi:hypothetical protein
MLKRSNELCRVLNETYNGYYLDMYPELTDIFVEVRDLYIKNPEKFPNVNKKLMSLIYNFHNQEEIPNVDYITGPDEVSKWESVYYNKIIYIFGENDHSNKNGCKDSIKKHMKIEKYLIDIFKNSPVFVDFYVELGVMLDGLDNISENQTLSDMLSLMKGCFGPLVDRECNYNVRIHGIDVRRINSKKYKISSFTEMGNFFINKKGKSYKQVREFKSMFGEEIRVLSNINNNIDIIKILTDDILSNKIVMKELSKSTITAEIILDFFITTELTKNLNKIKAADNLKRWFSLIKEKDIYPSGMDKINSILLMINATIMDIYTISRMFKVFDVKNSDHYPKEPHNIIYYAGNGHTRIINKFLKSIGFKRTEYSDQKILSCVNMKNIKQPLFCF